MLNMLMLPHTMAILWTKRDNSDENIYPSKVLLFQQCNNNKFSPELQYSPVYIRESPHQASKTRGYCIKLDLFELSVLAYLR